MVRLEDRDIFGASTVLEYFILEIESSLYSSLFIFNKNYKLLQNMPRRLSHVEK